MVTLVRPEWAIKEVIDDLRCGGNNYPVVHGCGRKAEMVLKSGCCYRESKKNLKCMSCWREWRDRVDYMIKTYGFIRCATCDRSYILADDFALYETL